jgi:hypothetical protein
MTAPSLGQLRLGARPVRLRVPLLFDVVIVSEADHIHWLNQHPGVVREVDPARSVLHRVVDQRLRADLGFGGELLPVFKPRSDAQRARQQQALEARLEDLRGLPGPERDEIADYVSGKRGSDEIGVAVQQWCGRLFYPQYRAARDTYEAAKLLATWPSAPPWKTWRERRSGRLQRAKDLVAKEADGDVHCIHGTTIGMENVARTVRKLRVAAQDERKKTLAPDDILRECLAAPPAVLRSCDYEVKAPFLAEPLTRQTLVVLLVARAFRASGDLDVAFLRDGWSRCPAHEVIPEMLRSVWHAAHHDETHESRINTWTRILHQVVS